MPRNVRGHSGNRLFCRPVFSYLCEATKYRPCGELRRNFARVRVITLWDGTTNDGWDPLNTLPPMPPKPYHFIGGRLELKDTQSIMEIYPIYATVWQEDAGYVETGELLGYKAGSARGEVLAFGESRNEAIEDALEVQWPLLRQDEENASPSVVVAR